jgi:hypothetical protein
VVFRDENGPNTPPQRNAAPCLPNPIYADLQSQITVRGVQLQSWITVTGMWTRHYRLVPPVLVT